MFLIAKIVRGRRLLHELEQQEKDEAAAALEAAHSISQVSRRLAARHQRSSRDMSNDVDEASTSQKTERRKSTRRKAHTCGSVDLSPKIDDRLSVRRTSSMPSLSDSLQDRIHSSSTKHYNYEDKLNRLQRRALRFTWQRLHTRNGGKRVENVFEEVFDRLTKVIPALKDIFTTRMFLCAMSRNETASLRDHAKFTVKMLDLVLKSMDVEGSRREDTGSSLDPRIIGRVHGPLRPYGLTGQHWEKLGEIIIDVVLSQEAVRDLPGAGQAWVIFTACLVDQLRAGFEENRSTYQTCPKRETVLYNATKHLYDSEGQNKDKQNMIHPELLSSTNPSSSYNNDEESSVCHRSSVTETSTMHPPYCRKNSKK
ncbi:hypothetical protein DICVIV_11932 [Dictyocaulus viviparus]|uniref:Globin n=1 Tax=Dictyocaulus viviparus TaxID=29172 RepID=A0A0D8XBW7_DICVI|nr:hypothetical protein DICVIV_11932 [Dictyocaulus viviparus]